MELNPKIKKALIDIDFVKRYEELSNRFSKEKIPLDERLIYIDGEEVMCMIQDLGYTPKFDRKEKFYKIKDEKTGKYKSRVHIALEYGRVELIWVVKEKNELILGSPWSIYSRLLIDLDYRIPMPVFGTYEDLEKILRDSFEMYEDFKRALVKE